MTKLLSFMVLLHKAMSPPVILVIPFKLVFCMGVGWFKKSSRYGVAQYDAPKSIIACCVISCVEALLASSITIFNNVLFWLSVLVWRGGSSSSPLAA
jgi:hypothetical protein